ncbi:MAG: GNAT family N-acetyltransferase [Oscillospiraceae bacterium]|nr:GNAT family N-acetyltransferase [Oscillospiraceae bacterium]
MNDITYRIAAKEDCYEIAKLKGEVWNTTYRGIYSDKAIDNYDVEKNRQTFEKIIENPKISLYVAEDAGKIVGFISCGEPYRPFLQYKQDIGLFYILKEYQRIGIGKKLFSIAKADIINNGYNEFFVSVNKYNKNAIDFYIAMGGSIIHIDEDKEDKKDAQIKIHYTV